VRTRGELGADSPILRHSLTGFLIFSSAVLLINVTLAAVLHMSSFHSVANAIRLLR
jgi:hypothetical protein